MKENEFIKILSSRISPEAIPTTKTKLAAVMVVIYGSDYRVIMTERPKTMVMHAGEFSFPGGTWSPKDYDLLETAIRETKEEIGISIKRENVVGQLNTVTTLNSGFTIMPFITITSDLPKLKPNSEIESILQIPLFQLFQTMKKDKNPKHRSTQEMYTFSYQNNLIWGASARIIKQMMLLFKKMKVNSSQGR